MGLASPTQTGSLACRVGGSLEANGRSYQSGGKTICSGLIGNGTRPTGNGVVGRSVFSLRLNDRSFIGSYLNLNVRSCMDTYYHPHDLQKFADMGKGNKELW